MAPLHILSRDQWAHRERGYAFDRFRLLAIPISETCWEDAYELRRYSEVIWSPRVGRLAGFSSGRKV
jgi:hypothetical protein